jgi:hypothetical protein
MSGGQRAGDRHRRRLPAACRDLLPLRQEVAAVLPARHARTGDHRTGLAQRQRLAAKISGQVDRPAALVRATLSRSDKKTGASRSLKGRANSENRPPEILKQFWHSTATLRDTQPSLTQKWLMRLFVAPCASLASLQLRR